MDYTIAVDVEHHSPELVAEPRSFERLRSAQRAGRRLVVDGEQWLTMNFRDIRTVGRCDG